MKNPECFLPIKRAANQKGSGKRTGWWLTEGFSLQSSFSLPENDLLYVKERLGCFSCGCGCFTREEVYAVNGQLYFHIAGFPIKSSKRGLYSVERHIDGTSSWVQRIRGRLEPPLIFSPSGCKVAYFQVSRLGDGLKVRNLC